GLGPLPTLVHLHGLLMTAWVALFVVQVLLIGRREIRAHQRLGYSGIALAIVIIPVAFVTALRAGKYGSSSTPPDIPSQAFMIVPMFDLVMFSLFFFGAVYYRRRPAEHKRRMLLTFATFV